MFDQDSHTHVSPDFVPGKKKKSQIHRIKEYSNLEEIVEVIWSNPPAESETSRASCRVQGPFEDIHIERLHSISWQHVPVLYHLHIKEVLSDV